MQVASGWISATVHVGNEQFLLAGAHLESTIPGYSPATDVQVAQAQELIQTLSSVTIPVVLCGDFNSDANDNPQAPDYAPTADMIQEAGYTEVWRLFHNGGISALTADQVIAPAPAGFTPPFGSDQPVGVRRARES